MMLDINFADMREGFHRHLLIALIVGAVLFIELRDLQVRKPIQVLHRSLRDGRISPASVMCFATDYFICSSWRGLSAGGDDRGDNADHAAA